MPLRRVLLALVVTLVACQASAQQSPFMSDEVFRALDNEVSGDIAFEHLRYMTQFHKSFGSDGFDIVARYTVEKAKQYGLEQVRYLKLPSTVQGYDPLLGELWLIDPEERRLAFTPEVQTSMLEFSRSAEVPSAELIDVGEGTSDADYAGKEVAGRIVLASGPPARVMDHAVWRRGALGIIVFSTARMPYHPDQVPWLRFPPESRDKTKKSTFGFVLSYREGVRLRNEMAARPGRPFKVRAKVESIYHSPNWQGLVEAVIPGTEIHDRSIVLTSHIEEERFSANDDGSGCASMLEVARALSKAIREGRLPRPRRDIRFWWVQEITAEEEYFSAHPEERTRLLANINQDMVGAKQSIDSRVQFVTREPASRASFLGDVTESILEALVRGNTAYLAAGQARQVLRGTSGTAASSGEPIPFSRPVLSRLGTHERYDARMVPFWNNSDQEVFNAGIIGVPSVAFNDYPDEFIHSSDDDLWQIDQTQLKRNALAVAAISFYLARAGEADVPRLAGYVQASGLARLGVDARTAADLVAAAAPADRAEALRRAAALVRHSARRERRALQSVGAFTTAGSSAEKAILAMLALFPTEQETERQLMGACQAMNGPIAAAPVTAAARERSARVPSLTDSVRTFHENQGNVARPATLHPLMAWEVLNFVDGRNSYQDIFEAVRAEADAAGEWYYGRVSAEDVAAYLDAAEKVGVVRVR